MTRNRAVFSKLKREHHDWSSHTCLCELLHDRGLGRMEIGRLFKLVDKDDYDPEDRDEILAFLYSL